MPRRDLLLLVASAALVATMAVVQAATGAGADILIGVPALLLLLSLAMGRYVGEASLARIARASDRPARRPAPAGGHARSRARRILPRGGLLIATALARRGPPPVLLAR
jgi:hypothetical protein